MCIPAAICFSFEGGGSKALAIMDTGGIENRRRAGTTVRQRSTKTPFVFIRDVSHGRHRMYLRGGAERRVLRCFITPLPECEYRRRLFYLPSFVPGTEIPKRTVAIVVVLLSPSDADAKM